MAKVSFYSNLLNKVVTKQFKCVNDALKFANSVNGIIS